MKITKIEQQKKNRNRYSLFMDGEFKIGVHEDVIVFLNLKKDMDIDDETYKTLILKEEVAKAKQSALKYINYRLRSRKEVYNKLRDLDYTEEIIDETFDFLERYAFINDLEFAKAYIHDKSTIAHHSQKKIRYDLRNKGISDQLIDELFSHEDNIENELASITKYVIKKFKQYKDEEPYIRKQKTLKYCTGKGFNYGLVKQAIELYIESEANNG